MHQHQLFLNEQNMTHSVVELKNRRGKTMQGPRLTHNEQYDGPLNPNASPPRYGAQRLYLPLRNNRGQIVEGPWRQKEATMTIKQAIENIYLL